MMVETDREQLLDYAQDAALILHEALQRIDFCQFYFYRVAAVQLRLLLCDTARLHDRSIPTALSARLWPELRLRPLEKSNPGLFGLNEWLDQKMPESEFSIRQFIRRIGDQDGGVHVDIRKNRQLPDQKRTINWIFIVSSIVLEALDQVIQADGRRTYETHFPIPSQQ
ncbi:MAG TPA: hypothetical protein VN452_03485 [Longilinea sp.]|nr:hypothetical protein [Longilinea sp.]